MALADDLVPVLRESLTNVAKHAGRFTEVGVAVTVAGGEVVLEVVDDGVGPRRRLRWRNDGGGLGHANLRARAESRGGSFEVGSGPVRGTRVLWRAPI